MAAPTPEQQNALDVFKQISEILAVPTEGKPLPDKRKWTLPDFDERALAGEPRLPDAFQRHPADQGDLGQTQAASDESKPGQPSVEDSPKQTERK